MNHPRTPKGTPAEGQSPTKSNPESELDLEDVCTPQSLVDYVQRSGYHAYLMGDKLCVWTDGEDHECCGDTLFDPSGPVDLGASNCGIVFFPQECQICGIYQDLRHTAVIDDDTVALMWRELDATLDSWEEIDAIHDSWKQSDEHRRAESVYPADAEQHSAVRQPQRSTDAY